MVVVVVVFIFIIGFVCMWNGIKDGVDVFVDYGNGNININEFQKVNIVVYDICYLEFKLFFVGDGYEFVDYVSNFFIEDMFVGNIFEGCKLIEIEYYVECKKIIVDIIKVFIVEFYIFCI